MKKLLLTCVAVAFSLALVPTVDPSFSFQELVHAATGNNSVGTVETDKTVETVETVETVDAWDAYLLEDTVNQTESGETVRITKDMGITTLSCHFARMLEEKNVALSMEYTYQGVDYAIFIPAGTVLDHNIPWYGPLYLNAHFGVSVTATATGGQTYTIQSGDTLSGIAARYGIPLNALIEMNAGLASQRHIYPGQQVRVN